MVTGSPASWSDLIDTMVPALIDVTIESWSQMPVFSHETIEDVITKELCRKLRGNRTVRQLPFQVHLQQVEIEPAAGESEGRLDIVFNPHGAEEDTYFCLEGKRLNVIAPGKKVRSGASEYVSKGLMRFAKGQYGRSVRHGGMIGYVRNGDISGAMNRVQVNIATHRVALAMSPPGRFSPSTSHPQNPHVKETHHFRNDPAPKIVVHHLFVA